MRDFFFSNPWMKVISLALAFFLWIWVRGERKIEVSVNVPVQITNKPERLFILGEVDPFVSVRLIGPQTRLSRIDDDYFKPYELNLSEARKGSNPFWVHEEDFRIPHGVRITRIVPQLIRIKLDELEERLVSIKPKFVDILEEGFELGESVVMPSHTRILGGKKELAAIQHVFTEPISLSGRRGSFEVEVSVPPQGLGSNDEEKKVLVKVNVIENEVSRILHNVPVTVRGFQGTAKIEPDTVSLNVKGPAGKVAALADEKLELAIRPEDLPPVLKKRRKFRIPPIPPKRPGLEIKVIPNKVLVTRITE